MTPSHAPRRGTPAYAVLERIHALGGKAFIEQLLIAVNSDFRSPSRLDKLAIVPLTQIGFITRLKFSVQMTAAGQAFLDSGAVPQALLPDPGTPRPLSSSVFTRMEERRPGALDYRDIPSMMGGTRVPYRASCHVSGQSGGGDGND